MKKLVCILLVLIMALGMVACGKESEKKTENKANSEEDDLGLNEEVTPADKAPNAEELEMLDQYYDAVKYLPDTGFVSGEEAEQTYKTIGAMKGIDKFIGTQWATSEYMRTTCGHLMCDCYMGSIDWDRRAVLKRFTIAEDQLLMVKCNKIDQLGNVEEGFRALTAWHYDENGTLLFLEGESNLRLIMPDISGAYTPYYTYYDDGRIEKITHYADNGDVEMVRTFEYDANNNIVKQIAKDNISEQILYYTCGENGRVEKIEYAWGSSYCHVITYTYDGNGKLTREAKQVYGGTLTEYQAEDLKNEWIAEHSYDSNGRLAETVYTVREYNTWGEHYVRAETVNQFVYEYDSKDRMIKAVETVNPEELLDSTGAVYDTSSESIATREYVFIYGDYYRYDAPVEQENG